MTVFWKQKWRDKFKVTWLLILYFFLSSRRFQCVKRCVQTFCEGWGRTWRRRFSMSETLVHVIHSRLRAYLNMWDDGFLRTNVLVDFKLKETWERFRVLFYVFFLGFLGLSANSIPCTLALNYFIILFLLFYLFIMDARNPEIRIHVWKVRTFIPAVLPHKGQELQTTDNELWLTRTCF